MDGVFLSGYLLVILKVIWVLRSTVASRTLGASFFRIPPLDNQTDSRNLLAVVNATDTISCLGLCLNTAECSAIYIHLDNTSCYLKKEMDQDPYSFLTSAPGMIYLQKNPAFCLYSTLTYLEGTICIWLNVNKLNNADARDACQLHGGDLVTMKTKKKFDAVNGSKGAGIWIGAMKQPNGTIFWVDNSLFDSIPQTSYNTVLNNDGYCMITVSSGNNRFWDYDCTSLRKSVCELPFL